MSRTHVPGFVEQSEVIEMLPFTRWARLLTLIVFVLLAPGQNRSSPLDSYFTGKEVTVKIDMPGSQKGIDLRFNKSSPMDWKEYSSRIKSFGISIHKGDVARITSIVVKNDLIEFQLNGGGFGTFGDDTVTTVTAKPIEKSDYEKNLEKQISETTDDDVRRRLQRDLDRERSRRERQDAANQNAAQVASQLKAQKVADNRLSGGSASICAGLARFLLINLLLRL